MAAAQAFRVQVGVVVGQGVPLERCPIVEVGAVVQQLHPPVVNAGADQRLPRFRRFRGALKHRHDPVAGHLLVVCGIKPLA